MDIKEGGGIGDPGGSGGAGVSGVPGGHCGQDDQPR